MKTIPLTQGKIALVSDCDYKYLMQWKWYFNKPPSRLNGYARRISYKPQQYTILMHKVVAIRKGILGKVDHHNQNTLDNRRTNLRLATDSQNQHNRTEYHNNTSGYKGVHWHKHIQKWQAKIQFNGRQVFLGYWLTPQEAAKAYNKAAKKYFGKFAWLNRIEQRRKNFLLVKLEHRSGRERRVA